MKYKNEIRVLHFTDHNWNSYFIYLNVHTGEWCWNWARSLNPTAVYRDFEFICKNVREHLQRAHLHR